MASSKYMDMRAMPIPLPDIMIISTSSRFFLKYCATIMVEQSLVKPTPTPTIMPAGVHSNTNRKQTKRKIEIREHTLPYAQSSVCV